MLKNMADKRKTGEAAKEMRYVNRVTPLLTLLLEVALQEAGREETKGSSHLLYLSHS